MQQSIKSLNLPSPIAAYFAADKVGGEAVSQCFTENAIVLDEGHSYQGRAEIRAWKSGASAKYQYTTEPFVHPSGMAPRPCGSREAPSKLG